MFDEHVPQSPAAPMDPAKDIFEEIPSNLPFAPAKTTTPAPEPVFSSPSALGGGTPSIQPPMMPGNSNPLMSYEESPRSHGLRTILLVLASIIVIGIAGFLAYKLVIQPKDVSLDSSDISVPVDTKEPEEVVPVEEAPVSEPVVEAPVVNDTDGDGLNDEEENKAGTDAKLADSDRDGLGDREEIQVYGTDPLDSDTDNDSYLDGQEVKSGFNPNGQGKLFEIPR